MIAGWCALLTAGAIFGFAYNFTHGLESDLGSFGPVVALFGAGAYVSWRLSRYLYRRRDSLLGAERSDDRNP